MKYTVEHDRSSGYCLVRVSGEHKRPEDSLTLQGLAQKIRSETNN